MRKYLPTLGELIDRLTIVQLKEVKIPQHKKEYQKEIEEIGENISLLKKDKKYLSLKKSLKKLTKTIEDDLAFQRKKMKASKLDRRYRKRNAKKELNAENYKTFSQELVQESFNDQFFYKELVEYYEAKIEKNQQQLSDYENRIQSLKNC